MRYTRSEAKAYARANMRGIWAAIPYPFATSGELDEARLRKDVRHYIDTLQIDGLFCGGLVGEYWSLTMKERERSQRIVIEEAGPVPVIAHTGCQSVRETVILTQRAQAAGATYAVFVNPPLNPHAIGQTLEFFRRACSEIDIGISLFNAPESGYVLAPETVAEIADIENVVCVKNPLPLEHTHRVRQLAGDRILVFDPSEARFLDNIIKYGDLCYMSGPAPILLQTPGDLRIREYARLAWAGDIDGARRVSASLAARRAVQTEWITRRWLAHELPIAEIKAWVSALGLCSLHVRPPLARLPDMHEGKLVRELVATGLVEATVA